VGQRTIVVIAGGERAPTRPLDLADDVVVVAADSGVDYAHALGLRVDVAIGDFDSVTAAGLRRAAEEGGRVERHPVAKDATDLELALAEARRLGATDLIVLGIGGGRLDHLLANVLVLAAPELAPCRVTAHAGPARIHVVRGGEPETELLAGLGETVTLVPVGGEAIGITTEGLLYPLLDEPLRHGTSRGVSNVVTAVPARVQLAIGTLLAVIPGDVEGVIDA